MWQLSQRKIKQSYLCAQKNRQCYSSIKEFFLAMWHLWFFHQCVFSVIWNYCFRQCDPHPGKAGHRTVCGVVVVVVVVVVVGGLLWGHDLSGRPKVNVNPFLYPITLHYPTQNFLRGGIHHSRSRSVAPWPDFPSGWHQSLLDQISLQSEIRHSFTRFLFGVGYLEFICTVYRYYGIC